MSARSTYAEAVGDILPSQWYGGSRRKDLRFHWAKQLMLAVLVDALRCLQTARVASTLNSIGHLLKRKRG
jgi:hypothetical protein